MNSNNIKCLIVDDEKLARTLLKRYIEKLPNLELIRECKNAVEAIPVLHNEHIDLIFLDIQMPELTGIEFLNTLQEKPLVIFTTAYQQYALEGYQLDIVDYLLKPFRFNRFLQAVNKAARRLNTEEGKSPISIDQLPKNQEKDSILIKSSHTVFKVFLDEIVYIQGMKEYVAFYLAGKRIITLQSLKQLEKELPGERFMRIHKSYIISTNKVTAINSSTIYIGKEKFPIGGLYKEDVQKKLFSFFHP